MNTPFVRSSYDKVIAGVCSGLARYFGVDPVLVRLLFVLAVFFGGVSPLVYVVLWIIMPQEQRLVSTAPQIADHPRPAEQWKYDPYTGEAIRK